MHKLKTVHKQCHVSTNKSQINENSWRASYNFIIAANGARINIYDIYE